ncbi:DUF7768 domain-containing protein [Caproicibacter fermentans]|uniref:DUF4406 domain-containing protein n=1 Tax=Caproicibacter fermentans TaxID=2576756 RepID=A0A7G8TD62_9FIRM|nr:DUF4406 domain-containing protein [Caproicibacter fermentans]QNK41553.1 DUF4406 domain-containing protein [Caproicibacter fermentans]
MFEKLVYICSPYHGVMERNRLNAVEYCEYAAQMGVIPLAPHTIFTQYLDDDVPSQREVGLKMGLELLRRCDELWVFGSVITEGMEQEIIEANISQIPIRLLPDFNIHQETPLEPDEADLQFEL